MCNIEIYFLNAETLAANALLLLNKGNKRILTYEMLVNYANSIQRQLKDDYEVINLIDGRYINGLRENFNEIFNVEGDSPYVIISFNDSISTERIRELFYYSIGSQKIASVLQSDISENALFKTKEI